VAAGERAAGLAAPEEAQRYLDQAVALVADDARLRAELLATAGRLAYRAGRPGEARQRLEQAIDLQERLNEPAAAARASVLLADVDLAESRLEQASRRFAAAVEPLERAGAGEELAATLAELGRMQLLRGEHEQAAQALERALQLAETHALEEVLVQALTSKATLLLWHDRSSEAEILLRAAVDRSRAAGLHDAWWRAANNLALLLEQTDRPADSLALVEEIETQARQRGDREQLAATKLGAIPLLVQLGRWQEALDRSADPELVTASPYARLEVTAVVPVLCERGDLAAAQALLHEQEWQRTAEHAEGRASFAAAEARLLRLGGDAVGALAAARRGLACRRQLGITSVKVKRCLVEALEAALAGGSLDTAEQLLRELEQLPAGQLGSYLEGEHARFRARYAQLRDEGADVEDDYRRAETTFRVHGFDFELALSQREHADWLSRRDRNDEAAPLLAAARATLERLGTADGSGPARERPPAAPASTGVAQSA
jgi:tetratricopeptide (TPR) repeat protein